MFSKIVLYEKRKIFFFACTFFLEKKKRDVDFIGGNQVWAASMGNKYGEQVWEKIIEV